MSGPPAGSRLLTMLVCLFLSAAPAAADGLVAAELRKTAGTWRGLVVHLVSTDGRMEIDLVGVGTRAQGQALVCGLALDDASLAKARRAITAAGIYGLASVHRVRSLKTLPFADNTVDLLVGYVNAAEMPVPHDDEIMRVLAPGGTVLLERRDRLMNVVKPRPKEMDDWTHYDYGAGGNPVSRDTLVGPVTALRWYAGPTISRAGSTKEPGLRLGGGRIVYVLKDYGYTGRQRRGMRNHLVCRNAYNGMPLWKRPIAADDHTPYRHELIAAGERVYAVLEPTGPMVALDAATGAAAVEYSQGAHVQAVVRDKHNRADHHRRHFVARLYGRRLIQAYRSTIHVLDAATGKRLWTYQEGAKRYIPLVVAGEGKVFAVVGGEETIPMRGTVAIKADSVVALDLASGKLLWRNRDVAGKYVVRLVYAGGNLPIAYFPGTDRKGRKGQAPMTGFGHKFAVANIRAADGRTMWHQRELKSVGGHYAITFVRDAKAYVACERYIGYDLKTGAFDRGVAQRTFVNACAETRATSKYVLYGMSFADRDGRFSPRAIARSTCDTGVFPGYGLVYCSPPLCSCLDVLAGYTATAAERPAKPVPAKQRLVAGEVKAPPPGAGHWPKADEWPMFMANPKRGCWTPGKLAADLKERWRIKLTDLPGGAIVDDWHEAEVGGGPITAPTAAGGRVFVAAPNRHRLDARDAGTGKRVWSFTAGGRIDSPPTIYNGLCLFGCRDGWVYALRAADGKLVWQFLAAASEKRIVDSGHVESPWPVFGSVMIHDGKLFCTAGRHSAVDGGIRLCKLDPATGRLIWSARIASASLDDTPGKEIPVYSIHGKIGKYYPRAAHLLVSDGRKLHHFIETLKDSYSPGELVALHASNGRWDRVPPADMTWMRSNMMGFISRRRESVGRFDYNGVRYSDVNAAAIAIAGDSLYCVDGRRAKTRGGFGQLTRLPLDADGRVGQTAKWKAQIRHQDGKRVHGNFRVAAMIVAGEHVLLAGHEREKPASAVHAYSAADGRKLAQWPLPARPLPNGLAAAGGQVYVSCEDGSLVCLGR